MQMQIIDKYKFLPVEMVHVYSASEQDWSATQNKYRMQAFVNVQAFVKQFKRK